MRMLFVVGPALGHVARSLVVARAVREANTSTDVVFAAVDPGYGVRMLPPEFSCLPIPHRRWWPAGRVAEQFERTISTLDPDLVCLDLDPVHWIPLVRFPDVPRAFLTNSFLTLPANADTFQAQASVGRLNRQRVRRGLPEIADGRALYASDAVLLCDPPELANVAATFTEPYYVVGACVWQADGPPPSDLDPSERLLLLALGSTGRKQVDGNVIDRTADALHCDRVVSMSGELPWRVAGRRAPDVSLAAMEPLVNQSVLVVTQGGVGSTYAALQGGVPTAVWPTLRNHRVLADQLDQAGVGGPLAALSELGPEQLRQRVESMTVGARRIAAASAPTDGPERAAAVLHSLL